MSIPRCIATGVFTALTLVLPASGTARGDLLATPKSARDLSDVRPAVYRVYGPADAARPPGRNRWRHG